jgi:tetratricopeptide (TPR) repeat protein
VTVLPPPPIGAHSYHHQIAVSLIEDVAIGLCRFRGLTAVAPHTSAELSLGGKKTLFRTFGIDYAVETQLQDRAGEVWLSVKLINARSRKMLWADQYEFNRDTIARQYREMSVRIVLLLVDRIERAELARYDVEQNPTAYHLFLRGQRFLRALDLPNVRRARREFRNAIAVCPEFVPAITSLARTFQREWLLLARGDRDLLSEAERLARTAIEFDPDDARGYRELGNCTLFVGRFDESLRAYELAEQRNPQHADLLADLADALSHACEPAAALQKITKAIDLNPLCPDHYWWAAGGANFHLKRYADAIECMSRMRDQSPAYRLMAASWAMLGDQDLATEYVRKTKNIHPDFSVNGWLSILPIRNAEYAQHYAQSLREAGFE